MNINDAEAHGALAANIKALTTYLDTLNKIIDEMNNGVAWTIVKMELSAPAHGSTLFPEGKTFDLAEGGVDFDTAKFGAVTAQQKRQAALDALNQQLASL